MWTRLFHSTLLKTSNGHGSRGWEWWRFPHFKYSKFGAFDIIAAWLTASGVCCHIGCSHWHKQRRTCRVVHSRLIHWCLENGHGRYIYSICMDDSFIQLIYIIEPDSAHRINFVQVFQFHYNSSDSGYWMLYRDIHYSSCGIDVWSAAAWRSGMVSK